jgi:predicted nuclease of restriction endonuclease-like (RecB) superfamily
VLLYWHVGQRIRTEILQEKRAGYGEAILSTLSKELLFERTALSKKPAELARKELAALRKQDRLTPDLVFRDPYLLDFLGLADTYSEKDLEAAILRELEQFILELGVGFAFIDRKSQEQVELLQLEKSGIRIASYLTDLPPRPLLQKKLHDAVRLARARLETVPMPSG